MGRISAWPTACNKYLASAILASKGGLHFMSKDPSLPTNAKPHRRWSAGSRVGKQTTCNIMRMLRQGILSEPSSSNASNKLSISFLVPWSTAPLTGASSNPKTLLITTKKRARSHNLFGQDLWSSSYRAPSLPAREMFRLVTSCWSLRTHRHRSSSSSGSLFLLYSR